MRQTEEISELEKILRLKLREKKDRKYEKLQGTW